MKIHHIGYACKDITEGISQLKLLFNVSSISDIVYDELHNAQLCLVQIKDGHCIELVSGESAYLFINKNLTLSLYHICFEVEDIFTTIEEYVNKGAVQVSLPKPAKLFENRLVTFFHTELGLIEILESKKTHKSLQILDQIDFTFAKKIIIASTFTIEPLNNILKLILPEMGMYYKVQFTTYNQIFQELLNSQSLFSTNTSGYNIILIKFDDWFHYKNNKDQDFFKEIAQNFDDLIKSIKLFREKIQTPLILITCPPNQELINDKAFIDYISRLELLIKTQLVFSNFYLISYKEILETYNIDSYWDSYTNEVSHIPYTMDFFSILSIVIARTCIALQMVGYKVIILDCDNTLWTGVCGEVGVHGIHISDNRKKLQQFIVEKHQQGFLICLCSKNNEQDVLAVFAHYKDKMPLTLKHITDYAINWNRKSENIMNLASRLNLSLDSVIFIDDNSMECAEISAACPDVLVLQLPEDDAELVPFLKHNWAFDKIIITDADKKRTKFYKENREREKLQVSLFSYDDFIASLDLKVEAAELSDNYLSRASQLTERTNQFNCTGIKRTISEIQSLLANGYMGWIISVNDRFGDYGQVGLVMFVLAENFLQIDTFLLSCRVLGKGIEYQMLAKIGEFAINHNKKIVKLHYLKSEKNIPSYHFITSLINISCDKLTENSFVYQFNSDYLKNIKFETDQAFTTNKDFKNSHSKENKPSVSSIHSQFYKYIQKNYASPQALSIIKNKTFRSVKKLQSTEYVSVNSDGEEKLINIIKDVMQVETVNMSDDFFDIGGNSLLAVLVVSRIRKLFKVDIKIEDIFQYSILKQLLPCILRSVSIDTINHYDPISKRENNDYLPLSYSQQRLWFLEQFEPNLFGYNMPMVLSIKGNLNSEALEYSLQKVIDRHEILRTVFRDYGGEPQQIIIPQVKFTLNFKDWTNYSKDQQFDYIQREAKLLFDLSSWPLIRITLCKTQSEFFLLITMHHIIFDGWSYGVMYRELTELYQSYVHKNQAKLPIIPIQYADYTLWQKKEIGRAHIKSQLKYWEKQLNDIKPLELPIDYPRPSKLTYDGNYIRINIVRSLYEKINVYSRNKKVSLFTTLLSVFDAFLAKYACTEDVVIGTPIAGRNLTELEQLIGFFVNTLILKTKALPHITFDELVHANNKMIVEALNNQDIPFEKIVEHIRPDRDQSRNPLFQVIYAHQNMPNFHLHFEDTVIEEVYRDYDIVRADLTLETYIDGNELRAGIFYNINLFKETTIKKIVVYFTHLLEQLIDHPIEQLGKISLLPETERKQLIAAWTNTQQQFPHEKTAYELFEEQASKHPLAIAVTTAGISLTYAELNAKANQLAHCLKTMGVEREKLVVLMLDRNNEYLVSMLGTWKAGGAFIPINPLHPQNKNRLVLEQTSFSVLLTNTKYAKTADYLVSNIGQVVIIDNVLSENWSSKNLSRQSDPHNLAYVIFTSGSTGIPKGVMIQHDGMLNHLCGKIYDLQLSEADNVAQIATQVFDVSIWQYMAILLTGGRVTVFTDESAWEPTILLSNLKTEKITIFESVPAHMAVILDELENYPSRYDLLTLRWFIMNGEPLHSNLCIRWFKLYPDIPMINAYGPTECSDDVSHYKLFSPPKNFSYYIPINGTLPNMQLYVLDDFLNPVPAGVKGELFVGGIGVGRGYLNDHDKTAQSYITNPFCNHPGSRLYKTGDIVRYRDNGELEFISRKDHQVKIRGFRIELGEIESRLNKYSGVAEGVVVCYSHGDHSYLIAYVTSKLGNYLEIASLRYFLAEALPDYMIPTLFIILKQFPLTVSGKIDRKALPQPDISKLMNKEDYIPPRTDIERKLVDIWEEVLKLSNIGVRDNFFKLGGHSLVATKVISRIRTYFKINLPVRILFELQTIETLAKRMITDLLDPKDQEKNIVGIERNSKHIISFAQQRLWFLDLYQPGNSAYNLCLAFKLQGAISYNILEKSFAILIQRHEILRTVFEASSSEPLQKIKNHIEVPMNIIQVSNNSKIDKLELANEILLTEFNKPFDLVKGPLFKIIIIRLDQNENIISIFIHHIITDRWSIDILIKELGMAYLSLSKNEVLPFTDLKLQYADYAHWQKIGEGAIIINKQMSYWLEKLSGELTVLNLPNDFPRPIRQTYHGNIFQFNLDKWIVDELKSITVHEKSTFFSILLSSFAVLLHRYSNQNDILIGSPIANRHYKETEDILGCFLNTLVLRIDLSDNPTFRELVNKTKELTFDAYANQDVPFEKLVEELQVNRDLSRTPIFQVMFVLQNLDLAELVIPEINVESFHINTQTAKFDITLFCEELKNGGLNVIFEYNTDLFKLETIARMASNLNMLLTNIIKNPDDNIDTYNLLTSEELRQIALWNDTTIEFPVINSLHEHLNKIALEHGNDIAVSSARGNITYSFLNLFSEQLADYLLNFKTKEQELIAIIMEKGWEQVVAIYAILKAHAAYLPISPTEPPKRLTQLLEEGDVNIILTQDKYCDLFSNEYRVIAVDTIKLENSQSSISSSDHKSSDLAYVIFTSGSTGLPKGVMISHENAYNTIYDINQRFNITENDCILGLSALNFDLSAYDIFGMIAKGAKILLPHENEAKNPESWHQLFQNNKITLWNSTPALMEMFVSYLESTKKTETSGLKNLRLILMSGDWIPLTLPERIRNIFGNKIQIISLGGATEGAIWSIIYPIRNFDPQWKSIPYGKAMTNQTFYVLNSQLRYCPVGVIGELFIGGVGIAQGYWHDPVKTQKSFIFHPHTGEKLYRTGDLGRLKEDGNIEFIGRIDHQVKIRGYRVELGEIECKLREHPEIKDAVAIIAHDQNSTGRLIVYYVSNHNKIIDKMVIASFLEQTLPHYMLPAAYVHLSELPISTNGKIDKKALLPPTHEHWLDNVEYVAPKREDELLLTSIWSDLLNTNFNQIGLYNNFFKMGGHSLLAARTIAAINKEFNVQLSVRDLFENPTIFSILKVINNNNLITSISKNTDLLTTVEEGEI